MKTSHAIIISGALISLSILLSDRYQSFSFNGGTIIKLDSLTGSISTCSAFTNGYGSRNSGEKWTQFTCSDWQDGKPLKE